MNEKSFNSNDETRLDAGNVMNANDESPVQADAAAEEQPKSKSIKGVLFGGAGVIAGVVGAMGVMAFREIPQVPAPEEDGGGSGGEGGSVPEIPEPDSLEDIKIATSPDDTLCFNDAFAAAREEVGPNGVFEWRGGVYGTYYAEEWENFSDEFKEEFASRDWLAEIAEKEGGGNPLDDDNLAAFGEHTINVDEQGNEYISLRDAVTGEEVRVSPDDLQFAVLDERGQLIGVISEDQLARIEEEGGNGVVLLNEDGELSDYVRTEDLFDDEDLDDLLNELDDDLYADNDEFGADEVEDYLDKNNLPDYANDEPVDDFAA